jgi:hypothetical protein
MYFHAGFIDNTLIIAKLIIIINIGNASDTTVRYMDSPVSYLLSKDNVFIILPIKL